jgi:hypothetical protein
MAVALCLAVPEAASPQAPITKTKSVSATATIQAIDATGRMITLKDESGAEDTYSVGPEVKRFNELKVGDTVKMTYYESVVLVVRKPGETPVATASEPRSRGTGALPSATMAVEQNDGDRQGHRSAVPSATVTTGDGRTRPARSRTRRSSTASRSETTSTSPTRARS